MRAVSRPPRRHGTIRHALLSGWYDLDGPASAEKLERIRGLRERERDRADHAEQRQAAPPAATVPAAAAPPVPAPEAPPARPATRPALAAMLTAAGVLFAALAWLFLRHGMSRPPRPSV